MNQQTKDQFVQDLSLVADAALKFGGLNMKPVVDRLQTVVNELLKPADTLEKIEEKK